MANRAPGPKRSYPEIYERAIPVALALIGLAILVLLLVVAAVLLRLVPGKPT